MSRSRARRSRRGKKQWVEILRKFETSGLGQKAFCAREGVALSSLQRWRHRLKAVAPAEFVELVPARPLPPAVSGSATGWCVELVLPNGACLRVQG